MSKTCDVNRLTTIYVLKDPRFDTIRYVGKTVKSLDHRLTQHISDSIRKPGRYVSKWIKSLTRINLRPLITQIDVCSWGESQEREILQIRRFKEQGTRLTNLTVGGEGNLGNKHSETQKRKFRETIKAKSRPVYQYMLTGELVMEYKSIMDVVEEGFRSNNVHQCCKGRKKSHNGFVWSFDKVDSKPYNRLPVSNRKLRKVDAYNLNNEYLNTYNSFEEAATATKVHDSNIHKVISGKYKQTGGYIFRLHGN